MVTSMSLAMATSDPYALPAFVLSIVGLAVASLGAATGITSLVWQIVTRTRGAHRIRVRLSSDMYLLNGRNQVGPYISIEIINRGASAVQVRSWSIDVGDGNSLFVVPALFPPQEPLPYDLKAGSSVSFVALSQALRTQFGDRSTSRARAVAHLGTGQTIFSKRGTIKL